MTQSPPVEELRREGIPEADLPQVAEDAQDLGICQRLLRASWGGGRQLLHTGLHEPTLKGPLSFYHLTLPSVLCLWTAPRKDICGCPRPSIHSAPSSGAAFSGGL